MTTAIAAAVAAIVGAAVIRLCWKQMCWLHTQVGSPTLHQQHVSP